MCLPSGSWSGQNFLTKLSLTTITLRTKSTSLWTICTPPKSRNTRAEKVPGTTAARLIIGAFSDRSGAPVRVFERRERLESGALERGKQTEANACDQRAAGGKQKQARIRDRIESGALPPARKLHDDAANPGKGEHRADCP